MTKRASTQGAPGRGAHRSQHVSRPARALIESGARAPRLCIVQRGGGAAGMLGDAPAVLRVGDVRGRRAGAPAPPARLEMPARAHRLHRPRRRVGRQGIGPTRSQTRCANSRPTTTKKSSARSARGALVPRLALAPRAGAPARARRRGRKGRRPPGRASRTASARDGRARRARPHGRARDARARRGGRRALIAQRAPPVRGSRARGRRACARPRPEPTRAAPSCCSARRGRERGGRDRWARDARGLDGSTARGGRTRGGRVARRAARKPHAGPCCATCLHPRRAARIASRPALAAHGLAVRACSHFSSLSVARGNVGQVNYTAANAALADALRARVCGPRGVSIQWPALVGVGLEATPRARAAAVAARLPTRLRSARSRPRARSRAVAAAAPCVPGAGRGGAAQALLCGSGLFRRNDPPAHRERCCATCVTPLSATTRRRVRPRARE